MTKKEVVKIFDRDIRRGIPSNDKPMLAEAWNNFTDALCKSGQITLKQYETWTTPF